MNLTWRNPPAHHWYAAKSPGLSIQCRSSRAHQTTLARFRSGHLRSMTFVPGHSQVMKTTPELAFLSLNFHITATGGLKFTTVLTSISPLHGRSLVNDTRDRTHGSPTNSL
ncbi:uncharacterized protein TNCV_1723241 [Trichonephila clavipes]|nr:uncharacterized protein TNCV_1723241 [Trichonephila clavipes]